MVEANVSMERPSSARQRLERGSRWLARVVGLWAACALLGFDPVLAETNFHGGAAEPPSLGAPASKTQPAAAPSARTPREAARRLSKFEARRIRHDCRGRADEKGLKGQEREAYLVKCFFGRASRRSARRDCAALGAAKGLEKAALQDFVRECVKERARPKD